MPTYVYKFVDTDETIEVQQSFHDDALTEAVHPVTGATLPVKKVYLPVGVTFKGDGFYKTDSRASKNGSKAGASTGSDSKGSADSGSSGGGSTPSSSDSTSATTTSSSSGGSGASAAAS
jgi:predicted nucleic acid-binding Zn ribbon protein